MYEAEILHVLYVSRRALSAQEIVQQDCPLVYHIIAVEPTVQVVAVLPVPKAAQVGPMLAHSQLEDGQQIHVPAIVPALAEVRPHVLLVPALALPRWRALPSLFQSLGCLLKSWNAVSGPTAHTRQQEGCCKTFASYASFRSA